MVAELIKVDFNYRYRTYKIVYDCKGLLIVCLKGGLVISIGDCVNSL